MGKTTVHFWTGGSGSPLVLIHGFGADSRFQWYEQVPELAKKITLVVPDLEDPARFNALLREFL